MIHRQNQIEVVEILGRHLAGAHLRQIVVANGCGALRSLIRRFAGVIAVRSGRIHLNLVAEVLLSQDVTKYALCGRRATDISHTNK